MSLRNQQAILNLSIKIRASIALTLYLMIWTGIETMMQCIKGDYVNMCAGLIGFAVEAEKKGEERAYEAVSHIMNGIIDGLSDNDIASKYDVDVRRVQKIRADMHR